MTLFNKIGAGHGKLLNFDNLAAGKAKFAPQIAQQNAANALAAAQKKPEAAAAAGANGNAMVNFGGQAQVAANAHAHGNVQANAGGGLLGGIFGKIGGVVTNLLGGLLGGKGGLLGGILGGKGGILGGILGGGGLLGGIFGGKAGGGILGGGGLLGTILNLKTGLLNAVFGGFKSIFGGITAGGNAGGNAGGGVNVGGGHNHGGNAGGGVNVGGGHNHGGNVGGGHNHGGHNHGGNVGGGHNHGGWNNGGNWGGNWGGGQNNGGHNHGGWCGTTPNNGGNWGGQPAPAKPQISAADQAAIDYVKGKAGTWLIGHGQYNHAANGYTFKDGALKGYTAVHQGGGKYHIMNGAGDKIAEYNNGKGNDKIASPVALDLNGDGKISTTGVSTARDRIDGQVGQTIAFDIDGDGTKEQIEWITGGDGLVVDMTKIGANGEIDGNALMGDQGGRYADGYQKMATYDQNGDGQLTGGEMANMGVWVDANGNGKVDAGELRSAADAGVTQLSTQRNDVVNERGETLMQSTANNGQMLSEDVWFAKN